MYTSISTACYAILTQPKERTEPYLRITPLIKKYHWVVAGGNPKDYFSTKNTIGISVWIENVGHSNALNIEAKCQLTPDTSILLKDNGFFKERLLKNNEVVEYKLVEHISPDKLLSQKLLIEVVYSNEDDKKQKPITMECLVKDLEENLKIIKTES